MSGKYVAQEMSQGDPATCLSSEPGSYGLRSQVRSPHTPERPPTLPWLQEVCLLHHRTNLRSSQLSDHPFSLGIPLHAHSPPSVPESTTGILPRIRSSTYTFCTVCKTLFSSVYNFQVFRLFFLNIILVQEVLNFCDSKNHSGTTLNADSQALRPLVLV